MASQLSCASLTSHMPVFTRSDDSPSSSCSHLTLASLWGMPPHLRRTVKRYPGMCNGNDKDAKTVCNDGRGGSTYVLIVPSNGSDPLYTEWSKEGSVDGKPFSNPVLNSTGERVIDCHTRSTTAAIHYLGWTLQYHWSVDRYLLPFCIWLPLEMFIVY